ncbi:MAG: polysaccharide deacetylase family protein [Desulfovermiculus sp.]
MTAAIKRALSVCSYRAGLTMGLVRLQTLFKPGKSNTFRILNYHRVNDFSDPFTIDSVAATDFKNQMRYIARHYHVMSLDEIHDRITRRQALPRQCLAITFDDGYADNYNFAYPILKKYELTATIFLTAGCVESRMPLWFDQVLFALKTTSRKKCACPLTDKVFNIQTNDRKLHAAHFMLHELKKADNDQRKKSVSDVLSELGVSSSQMFNNAASLLTWPQIMEMGNNSITFGSHTMTHPILAGLPTADLDWELKESRRVIEESLDREVRFFAYPNGKKTDYDERAIQAVKQAGYKAALTTEPHSNTPATYQYTWGRYRPWQDQVEHFSLALFLQGLSK